MHLVLWFSTACLGLLVLGLVIGLIPFERVPDCTYHFLGALAFVFSGIALAPWAHRMAVQQDSDAGLVFVVVLLIVGWSMLRSPARS